MYPLKGSIKITSPFGMRKHPITGVQKMHNGEDIVSLENNWTVYAPANGVVTEAKAGYNSGRGNLVRIDVDGDILTFQHLASINAAKGQLVSKNDVIGIAGSTGDSTGRHLHFEVTRGGVATEPGAWLKAYEQEKNAQGEELAQEINSKDKYRIYNLVPFSDENFAAFKTKKAKTPHEVLLLNFEGKTYLGTVSIAVENLNGALSGMGNNTVLY